MQWIVITVAVVVSILLVIKYYSDYNDYVICWAFGITRGISITLTTWFLCFVLVLFFSEPITETYSKYNDLCSIKTVSGMDGLFILGSGNINSYSRFKFYENVDGNIMLREERAYEIGIKEDATCSTAHVERIYEKVRYKEGIWKSTLKHFEYDKLKQTILHVPENSIIQSYELN